jgi:TM2 domain-containing membrane protein YozV
MKDKNLAAVLAFFGGSVGLHRFYLGQVGLGILYIFVFPLAAMIGVIDAIVLLSMNDADFEAKYNKAQYFGSSNQTNPTGRVVPQRSQEKRNQNFP